MLYICDELYAITHNTPRCKIKIFFSDIQTFMKNYLTIIFLLFSSLCFSQFYDDFSDGNYSANPRWFMSDIEANIVENNGGYAVELHPTGELNNNPSGYDTTPKTGEEYNMHKGSFRTANTLMDNTWWGCDLTFDVNKDSEGEIRFYITSSLPSLGEGVGFFIEINLENRHVSFIYENKTTEILATSEQPIPYGTTNLTCKITCNNKNWSIECNTNNTKNIHSQLSIPYSIQNATSTGFLLIENPDNPYNLRINSVNCGDKPTETELINAGDIVITEIMAKPNPAVELPEVEWIEIYNTTDRTLTLEDCKITTPAKTGTFSDYILEPQEYAVICSYNAMVELSAITNKICVVESMPTLNNDGNLLTLKNKQNHIISFVEYTADWYDSEPIKADGGWSLERRDPTNPLSNSTTWVPSIDIRGGTPAEINSTFSSLPDELIPCITSLGIKDNKSIQIHFNKPMQGEIVSLRQNINITENELKSLDWTEPQRKTLNIYLSEPLDSIKTIDISFHNFTCVSDWNMPDTTITLALPYQAQYMDIIFNELMPYVSDGNSKFIELYNNSNFYLDLNRLMLSNRDANNNLKGSKIFCSTSTILSPQQYAVISSDTSAINCPLGINPQSIYITATLPSIPASEGALVLTNRSGNVIDEVHYSNSWHHSQLTDLHDISLERINPIASTQASENWNSSASYNTAGWQNSQTLNLENNELNQLFWLENNTFSPNNDGYQDQLIIHHNLPNTGYTITIDAYTRHGAHICRIADNQLLGTQGYTLWDGTDSNNQTVPAGLYVLMIQTIHPNSSKIRQKLICIKI